jgi:hypothetical protein
MLTRKGEEQVEKELFKKNGLKRAKRKGKG